MATRKRNGRSGRPVGKPGRGTGLRPPKGFGPQAGRARIGRPSGPLRGRPAGHPGTRGRAGSATGASVSGLRPFGLAQGAEHVEAEPQAARPHRAGGHPLPKGVLGRLLEEGRLVEAAQRLRLAIDRVEDSGGDPAVRHRLQHNLAVILYRLGRFDEARHHLTQALTRPSADGRPAEVAESHFLHGLLVSARGESAEAAAAFSRALALRPGWLAALLHRGATYFALGDYVRAREDFQLANDASPKEPTVLYDLALADVMVGRWEEAQGLFRTLAAVDAPNGPNYYELLAQTYRAQTEDGFYGQLHRLKNMMGMVGDRLRLFREDASNLLDPGLRGSLGELSSQYDLIYHDLVAFLGAVRREPLELDVVDVHQVLDGALVAALPEGRAAPLGLLTSATADDVARPVSSGGGGPPGGRPGPGTWSPEGLETAGRVEVLKDWATDLPAIVCDPALIREAFLNIILNALEAMQGEGVLSITTGRVASPPEEPEVHGRGGPRRNRGGARERRSPQSAREPAEFIYVIFVDTGPGVAPEDAERIFHLGYSTKPFGSGIGLAQVRRALAVHGGQVEVTPGGPGAAFTVYLPCQPRLSPSIEDLSPKARLPEDARELILEPPVESLRVEGKEEADLLL